MDPFHLAGAGAGSVSDDPDPDPGKKSIFLLHYVKP